jgi:T5SS/PEP-CTERM-associated repeat protein
MRFTQRTRYVSSTGTPNLGAGVIGQSAGAVGDAFISGSGCLWEANGSLDVGDYGDGTLTLSNGGLINSVGAYIGRHAGSSGQVTVTGSGSVWTSTSDFVVGEGGSGTLTVANDGQVTSMTMILIRASGEARGTGCLQGLVSNGGQVAPGISAATLRVDGDYVQLADGTLAIEIGGTTPGSGHDVLDVTGAATLNGQLHTELIDDFVPEVGQEFTILTAGSVIGEFLTVTGQGNFSVTYDANGVTLTALPLGDLNGDGCVNQADLGILLADWGCTSGDCPGDLDGNGDTDQADLGILLAHWGEGCP